MLLHLFVLARNAPLAAVKLAPYLVHLLIKGAEKSPDEPCVNIKLQIYNGPNLFKIWFIDIAVRVVINNPFRYLWDIISGVR